MLFLLVLGFILGVDFHLSAASRVLPLRIPDRNAAEQYNKISWWRCCCGSQVNQQFMEDVHLLYSLVMSLKISSPASLRQLCLKISNADYQLTPEVQRQLSALGFLNRDNELNPSWSFLVLVCLLTNPEHMEIFNRKTAVEDILRRQSETLEILARNLNDIPVDVTTFLLQQYPMLFPSGHIELADIAFINATVSEIRVTLPDPFHTILIPKDIDDVFFDLGIVTDL